LDFITCELAKYLDYIYIFNNLETSINIIIGASTYLVGNIIYGGNWILKTTNVNVQSIYFTDNILLYSDLLGDSPITTTVFLSFLSSFITYGTNLFIIPTLSDSIVTSSNNGLFTITDNTGYNWLSVSSNIIPASITIIKPSVYINSFTCTFTSNNINNYTSSNINSNVTIIPAKLVGNYTGLNRVYNSFTNTNIIYTLSGLVQGDIVTISSYIANFTSPYVENNILITVSNVIISNTNYDLPTFGYTSANITPATIVPTFTINKTYDQTQLAYINYTLSGLFSSDIGLVTLSSNLYGYYASNQGGIDIPVTISSIILTGSLAYNYQIPYNNLSTSGYIYQ
jgi:hypothetical protein